MVVLIMGVSCCLGSPQEGDISSGTPVQAVATLCFLVYVLV